MTFIIALTSQPAVLDEFKARAAAGASNPALTVWLRSLPEMAGVYVPGNLKPIRARLGVPAKHGGKRAVRGKVLYMVREGRKYAPRK